MNTQEKSKVIAVKVGIELGTHIIDKVKKSDCPLYIEEDNAMESVCSCGYSHVLQSMVANHIVEHNPDFFTPEGQAVLAKALIEDYAQNHGASIGCHFSCYLEDKAIEGEGLLELIAETKLAELFYEFIEGEGK